MFDFLKRGVAPVLALAVVLLLGSVPARAVVIDFDDLAGAGFVPDGYEGITWNGQWLFYGAADGDYFAPHSAANRIFPTGNAPSGSFDFLSDVIFDGAWFNGFGESGPIFFELFLDGSLVHTSASLLLPMSAFSNNTEFLSSGYAGLVDQVTVRSTADYWIMDDVTYSVPEPASAALLLGGLLGAAVLRRRSRRP